MPTSRLGPLGSIMTWLLRLTKPFHSKSGGMRCAMPSMSPYMVRVFSLCFDMTWWNCSRPSWKTLTTWASNWEKWFCTCGKSDDHPAAVREMGLTASMSSRLLFSSTTCLLRRW